MRLNNRTLTNPFIYQGYESPKDISSTTASWTCGLKDFDKSRLE